MATPHYPDQRPAEPSLAPGNPPALELLYLSADLRWMADSTGAAPETDRIFITPDVRPPLTPGRLAELFERRGLKLTCERLLDLVTALPENPALQHRLLSVLRFNGEHIAAASGEPLPGVVERLASLREQLSKTSGRYEHGPVLREATAALIALCPLGTEFEWLKNKMWHCHELDAYFIQPIQEQAFFSSFEEPDVVRRWLKIESPLSFLAIPDSVTTEGYPVPGFDAIDGRALSSLVRRATGLETPENSEGLAAARAWGMPDLFAGAPLLRIRADAERILQGAAEYEDHGSINGTLRPYRDFVAYREEKIAYTPAELADLPAKQIGTLNMFALRDTQSALAAQLRTALDSGTISVSPPSGMASLDVINAMDPQPWIAVLHLAAFLDENVAAARTAISRRSDRNDDFFFLLDFTEIRQAVRALGFKGGVGDSVSALEVAVFDGWRTELAAALRDAGLRGKLNPMSEHFIVPLYRESWAKASFQGFRMNDGFDGIIIPDTLWERRGRAFAGYMEAMKTEHFWQHGHRGLLHPRWFDRRNLTGSGEK